MSNSTKHYIYLALVLVNGALVAAVQQGGISPQVAQYGATGTFLLSYVMHFFQPAAPAAPAAPGAK